MTDTIHFDWMQLSAFTTVGAAVLGFLWWIAQIMLSRNFVSHHDHVALSNRLGGLERQMDNVATKEEFRRLELRLGPLETGIAVMAEQVRGVRASAESTEHMVSMLVEHQLRKEVAP